MINRGFSPNRLRMIRSPVNLEEIRPSLNGEAFRQRHSIPREAFVVLSAGSMGLKQGLLNVVEAARQDRHACQWVLVGEGETRMLLEQAIALNGLGRVITLLPLQAPCDMSEYVCCG